MASYYPAEQGSNDRSGFSAKLTRVVKILLIVNIAAFLLRLVLKDYCVFDAIFGLVPAAVVRGLALWQPFTYFLFHSNVWHLLITLLIIWMFGGDVERAIGERLFMALYVFLPVMAACAALLAAPFSTALFLGPSAAVFGILTAFGLLFPERVVTLLLFFVIPVSVKAKYLAAGFILVELLVLFDAPAVAPVNFAPLAAVPLCFVILRYRSRIDDILRGGMSPAGRAKASPAWRRGYFIEKEIDPILDKISKEGMQSLTKRERKLLDGARGKMGMR
jgi:membrane associated rhomboid family serine protease